MQKIFFSSLLLFYLSLFISGCKQAPEPSANTPEISSISPDIITTLNKNITLSVGASVSDGGTLSYQWYLAEDKFSKGNEIENANDKDFIVTPTEAGLFYYYCIITNTLGNSSKKIASPRISITVEESISAKNPVILNQPQNITCEIGRTFSFEVIAYSIDEGELSYQWYFQSIDENNNDEFIKLEGATTSEFSEKALLNKIGSYFCIITNTISDNGDGGIKTATIKTNTIILSNNIVNANTPIIITQPQNATAIIPVKRTFSVGAYTSDDGELSYQWYMIFEDQESGTILDGETKSELTITAKEIGKTGYYCVITNTISDNEDGGIKSVSINSEIAWFDAIYLKDIISAPEFTVQPTALNIAPYNQSITITCLAESAEGSVYYRWYQSTDKTTANGTAIPNADTETFQTPIFTEKGIYYFYCIATNVLYNDIDEVITTSAVSNIVRVAYTGLPTLYLNTGDIPTAAITKEYYIPVTFTLISKEGTITEVLTNKGIKGRGNTTWKMRKKGYNLNFNEKISLFNLSESKKWCLLANYADKTLLRNKYASLLGTEDEFFNTIWNPSCHYVDLIMNNTYMGNYLLSEKVDIGVGRIEIQDISDCTQKKIKNGSFTDQNNDGDINIKDGGFLIEVEGTESRAKSNDFYFPGTKGGRFFCLKEPDELENEESLSFIKEIIQNAEKSLYSVNFTDIENGWRKYIDEDSIIDWYIVNEFTKNNDAIFYSSVYMYYNPTDGKLYMGPNWDFDLSCGNVNYNDCDNPEGWWIKKSIWISRLFADPLFVEHLKNRWNSKRNTLSQTLSSNGILQTLTDDINISADLNFLKWKILGKYVFADAPGYESRTTYRKELNYLINWISSRYEWMDSAINAL